MTQKKDWELGQMTKAALVAHAKNLQAQMESGEVPMDEPDVSMVIDPYDTTNPLKIKEHPPGFRLNWLNPDLRDGGGKGWKGWEPVEHDSEIGKELGKYLVSPPPKMKGLSTLDNYVRRGRDSVLCKLPLDLYWHRKKKKSKKAQRAMDGVRQTEPQTIQPGVTIVGEGVQTQERPAGGFTAREVRTPNVDPGQRTELFSENREGENTSEE